MFCGKYFRDTVWNGDHAMKIFTFLKRVFKDLKIIINKEYYCQMMRIMIGKLYSFKVSPILYHQFCKGVKTMALWMCLRGSVRGNIKSIIDK